MIPFINSDRMRHEEKITGGCFQITTRNVKHFLHSSSDGSWQETTADEIKRLIALLIYMGLVKIGYLDKYWCEKTPYYCLGQEQSCPEPGSKL